METSKVFSTEDWESDMNDVKILKADMNRLVMNLLVAEGHGEAAEIFQKESRTEQVDLESITVRLAVIKAIQSRNLQDAIEKLNAINPEILPAKFYLQKQRLIELIREIEAIPKSKNTTEAISDNTMEAIKFATDNLTPLCAENEALQNDFEKTFALLVVENLFAGSYKELLADSQWVKTAREVNAAIFTSQTGERGPKLERLLKKLAWIQKQMNYRAFEYPRMNHLSTDQLVYPKELYFSNYSRISARAEIVEDEEPKFPMKMFPADYKKNFTVLSSQNLIVTYNGHSDDHDIGLVKADSPAPTTLLSYYFEITVLNSGDKGKIAIGFSRGNFQPTERSKVRSCSYYGDSGFVYSQKGAEKTSLLSQAYTTGDTVGCGVNYITQEFFFTKNGILLVTIPKDFIVDLYPIVSLESENESVSVNFTPGTFAFDLELYKTAAINHQKMETEGICIPQSIIDLLVKNYLSHYGYEETLKTFHLPSETEITHAQNLSYSLRDRKYLREAIMKGEIDAALAKVHISYPELIKDDIPEFGFPEVYFLLHCQKFTELVRTGARGDAKTYKSEKNLSCFNVLEDMFEDCNTLLECEDPEGAGVAYLLGEAQKDVVADAVNAAILSSSTNKLESRLERLVRQVTICYLKYQGEPFSLYAV